MQILAQFNPMIDNNSLGDHNVSSFQIIAEEAAEYYRYLPVPRALTSVTEITINATVIVIRYYN